ncbi:hypothetical protein [Streptomyces sp. 1222.5]
MGNSLIEALVVEDLDLAPGGAADLFGLQFDADGGEPERLPGS